VFVTDHNEGVTPGELLALAAQSCVDAAKLLHELPVEVAAKGEFDQVSTADLEVEAFLRRALAVPGSAVVGEELGAASAPITWFVDPIDGTRNFVRGIPLSCISVAAAVDGSLVAGCVLDPFRVHSERARHRGVVGRLQPRADHAIVAGLLIVDFDLPCAIVRDHDEQRRAMAHRCIDFDCVEAE